MLPFTHTQCHMYCMQHGGWKLPWPSGGVERNRLPVQGRWGSGPAGQAMATGEAHAAMRSGKGPNGSHLGETANVSKLFCGQPAGPSTRSMRDAPRSYT